MNLVAGLFSLLLACSPAAKPARGTSCTDPTSGLTVTRLTDHVADGLPGYAVTEYSRRQAFNSNNTLVMVVAGNGYWHLYNATTGAYVKKLVGPGGDAEPQWNPTNPNKFWYVPYTGGLTLLEYDVTTDATTTVANFTGRLPWPGVAHIWTRSEGSPSKDARYWAFMAENASYATLGIFTYDLQTNTILATLPATERPDHVSMTPTGNFVEIEWGFDQKQGGIPARKRLYTRDLVDWTYIDCGYNHSDFALGANGHDYYIAVDTTSGGDPACSPANGYLFYRDLQAGFISHGYATARTDILPTYIGGSTRAWHISGRNLDAPGSFLFSTYFCIPGISSCPQAIDDRVIQIPLTTAPVPKVLATMYNTYTTYWTEPHASFSRDGKKAVFNSNWGTPGEANMDVYVVQLGQNTPPPQTPPVQINLNCQIFYTPGPETVTSTCTSAKQ